MRKKAYTISPDTTLREVVRILVKKDISGVVVVDENKKVIGIVSEKDVYRTIYPSYSEFYNSPEIFTDYKKQEDEIKSKGEILAKDFMTTNVLTVDPKEAVMKVGATMLARNIHRLPVVDEQGKLVGIITRGRIYHSLFKKKLGL